MLILLAIVIWYFTLSMCVLNAVILSIIVRTTKKNLRKIKTLPEGKKSGSIIQNVLLWLLIAIIAAFTIGGVVGAIILTDSWVLCFFY